MITTQALRLSLTRADTACNPRGLDHRLDHAIQKLDVPMVHYSGDTAATSAQTGIVTYVFPVSILAAFTVPLQNADI